MYCINVNNIIRCLIQSDHIHVNMILIHVNIVVCLCECVYSEKKSTKCQ